MAASCRLLRAKLGENSDGIQVSGQARPDRRFDDQGCGVLFAHDGVIYRPGQDSSRCYGYGIRLYELLTLTEKEYEENEVCTIEPRWAPDLLGVHTLNFEQGLSVADALIRRPSS